ncbi:MAG TPA: hypothetical protein VEJ38_06680 [Candidatus Acidoferrales bacterium]|nr:hypothetical protein [Candidatus Acidoferrales bacterium]
MCCQESPDTRDSLEDGGRITFTSSLLSEKGVPALRIWEIDDGSLLRMHYADGVNFLLERTGNRIWAAWPDTSTIEDAATYLLGPVLGFILRLRGVTCLHASAVALGTVAVAFVGVEGAGKSTTAAALARRGHAVISDDIVALTESGGNFFVNPAYPYMGLWADSASMLFGPANSLPDFSPNYDKKQLLLSENRLRFQEKPTSLGAIYLLGERIADDSGPRVEQPSKQESLLALVTNTYLTNLIDAKTRAKEFELLGRLVRSVPIVRLRPHQDASRIDRLCELIERRHMTNEAERSRSVAGHVA